jgi:hypothetical protein
MSEVKNSNLAARGHWLEGLMGIKANSDNAPDKYG